MNHKNAKQRKKHVTLKQTVAVILTVILLPFTDIADAYLSGTAYSVYAENEPVSDTKEIDVKEEEVREEEVREEEVKEADTNKADSSLAETPATDGSSDDTEAPKTLVIDGEDYVLTGKMKVDRLELKSGSLDLAGYDLEVSGDVKINGMLRFNKGTLVCGSDISFLENAAVYMRYGEDCLSVSGSFNDLIDGRKEKLKFMSGLIRLEGDVNIGDSVVFGSTVYGTHTYTGGTWSDGLLLLLTHIVIN